MNPEIGEIRRFKDIPENERKKWRQVFTKNLSPTHREILEKTGRTKIGVNESCPCGSGKKFKKCCKRWV